MPDNTGFSGTMRNQTNSSDSKGWKCPECETNNEESAKRCKMCNFPKPVLVIEPPPPPAPPTPPTPPIDTSKKKKKKKKIVIGAIVAAFALILVIGIITSSKSESKSTTSQSAQASNAVDKTAEQAAAAKAALDSAQSYIRTGDYYRAARTIEDCRSKYPTSGADCNRMWKQLETAAASQMPPTGELERTIYVQGGNELRFSAKSGNVEVLAVNVKKESEFVRFFIRKGDSTTVFLPGGEYRITFKIGDVWFSDEIGFGDYCSVGSFDENIEFKVTQAGNWVTYYYFEWTF